MGKWVLALVFAAVVTGAFAETKFVVACNQNAVGTATQDAIAVLMERALAKLGYALSLVPYPAERSLAAANLGVVDGELARPSDGMDAYKNLLLVSEPVSTIRTRAYTITGPVTGVTWDFLKDYRVASLIGAKTAEVALAGKMRSGEFIAVVDYDSAFGMLLRNRVDYVVMIDVYEAKYWLDRVKIKRTEPTIVQADYYFVLNRKHAGLAGRLAQAIREIKAEH